MDNGCASHHSTRQLGGVRAFSLYERVSIRRTLGEGRRGSIPHLSARATALTMTRQENDMVRNVRVRKAWKRQTARVAFPITVTKPNGETFIVAPTPSA